MDESEQGSALKRGSVRAAFSSWWSIIGILAASVSAFNLLQNAFKFELSAVLREIAKTYYALLHAPFDWLFDAFNWPRLPSWLIDAIILWVLIGGIVLRSAYAFLSAVEEHRDVWERRWVWNEKPRYEGFDWIRKWIIDPIVFFFGCVVGWPAVVLPLLWSPYIYKSSAGHLSIHAEKPTYGNYGILVCNMRTVVVLQAIALLVCLITWLTINALLELYAK